jgi:hypothetical protein
MLDRLEGFHHSSGTDGIALDPRDGTILLLLHYTVMQIRMRELRNYGYMRVKLSCAIRCNFNLTYLQFF